MADYKDIIAGTLSNIIDKVKDAAESGTVRDIYEHGASRAKSYGRIAKLTFEMNGESEELKRVYTEIGRLYFEQARDSAEGFFAPLFAQAEEITARIVAKEQEIQDMKAAFEAESAECNEPDIEVVVSEYEEAVDEFNEVVAATETDGAAEEPKE